MRPKTLLLLLAALLVLGGCRDEPSDSDQSSKASKAAQAARIEKEVVKRVALVEKDLRVRQTRMHTIRLVGFIMLAGGAVAGLVWLQSRRSFNLMQDPQSSVRRPEWNDHYPVASARILELPPPAPPAARIATRTTPAATTRRHRASGNASQNRNPTRNPKRKTPNTDETPRHS